MEVDEDDHFKVYSERAIDAGVFCWNPFMDLLGVLPSDRSNHSVSVYRLIDDKQTGSALLFNEKVPFRPTAIGWVPDKRGLTIGDVSGNVFVFDAERQRTIELQKVHDCPIRSIDWIDLGSRRQRLVATSAPSKLPRIFATPTSIQQLFGEATVDDSPELFNESLANSERMTILSVLGSRGQVQLYFGGSIPIGEFSIPKLLETSTSTDLNYIACSMSPDAASVAILGDRKYENEEVCLFIVNTALIRFRLDEISALARIECEIDWLLRSFNQSVSAIDRAVSSSFDELEGSLGNVLDELEEEVIYCIEKGISGPNFLKDFISKEFSVPNKLGKLSKSTMGAFDFLFSTLLSRVAVIVDHITLRCAELMELTNCTILGLSSPNELMARVSGHLRPRLNNLISRVRDTSLVLKYIFQFLEGMVDGAVPQAPPRAVEVLRANPKMIGEIKSLMSSSMLIEEGKEIEFQYLQVLSNQRRAISSKLAGKKLHSFSRMQSSQTPQMRWIDPCIVELIFEQHNGNELVVVQINVRTDEILSRIEFKAPEGSRWFHPRLYSEDHICAVLVHKETSSICVLRYSEWIGKLTIVEPEEYGFSNFFVAQQIPTKGASVCAMEVSGPRGLCSVYCEGGRMITLDLENADDEEDDDEEEVEIESSPSPEKAVPQRRGKKNLKKMDSLISVENRYESNTPSDDDGSVPPQRLRFNPISP